MEQVSRDSKTILLTGDLGFSAFEPFAEKFPDNFINAGIAEQNMAGIAAGLAMDGRRVFVYSIGNFPTLRCLEQWRNDICYHNLPVTAVVNGGGMAYGYLGMSHHATEDLSVLRTLPGMIVTAPADPVELDKCFDYICGSSSPGYLRLCRGGERMLHSGLPDFSEPRLCPLYKNDQSDTAIVMCGEIASMFDKVVSALEVENICADIYSSPFVKPLPDLTVLLSDRYQMCVTVEENSLIGGFGGAIAEQFAGFARHPLLVKIGLPDQYCNITGNHDFMREITGLSVDGIVRQIKEKRQNL